MSGKKLSYVRESCFTMDIVVRRGVKKFIISCQRVQTQNDSVSTVSMIHILCLYKTDKFDIIIKRSSCIFLSYNLFDPAFVYCRSFFPRIVNNVLSR